jgi:hypothetical protein
MLHGQLVLLAYDRRRRTFDGDKRWCFGLALRAAMLSDLYLTGHLEDRENEEGTCCPVGVTRPDDPVLRAVFDEIGDEPVKSWAQVVARNSQSEAAEVVRRHLETSGWLSVQPRRRLGVVPAARLELRDDELVSGLADRVAAALRRGIAGEPADERSLTLGLIGALGGLPTVVSKKMVSRHSAMLDHLTYYGIPPVNGMREAIYTVRETIERRMEPTRWGG